jgi:cytochrome c
MQTASAIATLVFLLLALPADAQGTFQPRFGFGKPATAEEIAGWDIDVRPDGTGLPPGRGSVAEGQVIYDAKCASCHGTFGESTDYMPIAGGVGTLKSDQPIRTTASKLNYATTLWDYINRAMPFQAPKTLTANEVYALTAYVLHLSDLLPADAALDRVSLVALKLPNRDGFTLDHGFGSRDGKPDTRNVACMKNCVREVRLSSELPEHARDAHGNLAEQQRPLGPVEGAPVASAATDRGASAAPGAGPAKTAPAREAPSPAGAELARAAGCLACHAPAAKLVGPSFKDLAARYAGDAKAEGMLAAKVRAGGSGTWGPVPMPPHPQVPERDARAMVAWMLGGAK